MNTNMNATASRIIGSLKLGLKVASFFLVAFAYNANGQSPAITGTMTTDAASYTGTDGQTHYYICTGSNITATETVTTTTTGSCCLNGTSGSYTEGSITYDWGSFSNSTGASATGTDPSDISVTDTEVFTCSVDTSNTTTATFTDTLPYPVEVHDNDTNACTITAPTGRQQQIANQNGNGTQTTAVMTPIGADWYTVTVHGTLGNVQATDIYTKSGDREGPQTCGYPWQLASTSKSGWSWKGSVSFQYKAAKVTFDVTPTGPTDIKWIYNTQPQSGVPFRAYYGQRYKKIYDLISASYTDGATATWAYQNSGVTGGPDNIGGTAVNLAGTKLDSDMIIGATCQVHCCPTNTPNQ